jgi:hypothetical protein
LDWRRFSERRRLSQIAAQQGIPLSTVANRYRSAFRLIMGQDYTPDLWVRLMGPVKLHRWLTADKLPQRTLLRPWRGRQPRLVPAAALQQPGDPTPTNPVINATDISADEIGSAELVWDIQALLARGCSDATILAELELSGAAQELIRYLRERQQDTL